MDYFKSVVGSLYLSLNIRGYKKDKPTTGVSPKPGDLEKMVYQEPNEVREGQKPSEAARGELINKLGEPYTNWKIRRDAQKQVKRKY